MIERVFDYSRKFPGGSRNSLTPARGGRVFDSEPRRTRVIRRAVRGANRCVDRRRARGTLARTKSLLYPRRQLAELGLPVVRRDVYVQRKRGGPGDEEQREDEGLDANHVALCWSTRQLGGW